MTDYELLRLEFNRDSFKAMLRDNLGCTCANCGSKADIEYHHVVPLRLGGTNKLSNIVPLCYSCHLKAHGAEVIHSMFRSENSGRPKQTPPKDFENIIWQYVKGDIGKKECQRLLGMPAGSKLNDKWYYKEFLKENHIVSHKNKIDLFECQDRASKEHKGKVLAIIKFDDGKEYVKYA